MDSVQADSVQADSVQPDSVQPDSVQADPVQADPVQAPTAASPLDAPLVEAYLRRLGVEFPAWPTADVLRELHLRHLRAVPFENLSVHLGEEIVLEERRLVEKVATTGRGGFCYELNGAFGALLTALGFDVTPLAGRVYGAEGRLGIPYDHLALLVRTVDAGEWLADVGFGAHSHHPLRFEHRGKQDDPGGVFRIVEAGAGERRGAGGFRPGRRAGRPAGVPVGGAAPGAGRLRGRGVVAQHLARVALHPVAGVLAGHGGRREAHPQRAPVEGD